MEYKEIKERFDLNLQSLERRLQEAVEILSRHEERFENNPIDYHKERAEKKKEQVEELKERIEQVRKKIQFVLNFNPVQEQLQEVQDDYYRATQDDWEKVPSSKFKTFQDIFAPPGHRILPKRRGVDYDSISLNVCILNPEYVPNPFAKEFGLVDLTDCPKRIQKLHAKAKAKPAIVNFFDHLQPMSPHGVPDSNASQRLLVVENFSQEHDGKIIIPTSRPSTNDVHRKIIQPVDSIYDAQRRVGHVEGSYEIEKPKILAIRNNIISILNGISGLRKDDPEVESVCMEIEKQMDELEDVRNVHKKGIYEVLRKIKKLQDSLGRHNPGASSAQLVTALSKITKRLNDIIGITGTMDSDREVLDMRINRGEAIMDSCFNKFKCICDYAQQFERKLAPNPFDEKTKPRKPTPQEVQKLRNSVERTLESLKDVDTLKVRPFNLYAAKLREKAQKIEEALNKGEEGSLHDSISPQDFEIMRDSAIKAFIISKIFKVQQEREAILMEISVSPEKTDIGYLAEKAEQLLEVVKNRQVYPFVETSYEFQYQVEIQKKVDTLARGLRVHQRRGLRTEEKVEMYERLKKYLEDINFEEVLAELN